MYVHTDEYGRKRKFPSAKAARQFFRRMEEKFVPSLKEDIEAFNTPTMGVGFTKEIASHRAIGSTRKTPGTEKAFSGNGSSKEYGGKVHHISRDRFLPVKDGKGNLVISKDGKPDMMRVKGGPVIGSSHKVDMADKPSTLTERHLQDHAKLQVKLDNKAAKAAEKRLEKIMDNRGII